MEDLSSLEGPPMRDERFSPISPVSPYSSYDPSRGLPMISPGSVSPLSTATRSVSGSISSLQFPLEDRIYPPVSNEQHRIAPLRTSRSQSSIRDAAHVPPRPASADHSSTTAPFWLLVNGRLVWVEDMKLWVLWDQVEAARSYEKGTYPAHVNQQRGVGGQRRNRDRGTWKSLPPLPHEIHHLLPMTSDLHLSDDDNAWQKPRAPRHYFQHSPTNTHLQVQWASLAGQLGLF
ncbi:hypothetical protein UA08_04151 [Talaromyces atroroseus]|uniref:Uncharacterized protein n=1 Tax=Talaromyces atroroseus TaxID=1441469 RepID=A0A1Q5Q8U0_TALAT|nr:hypothetical protein UA08_04151 [Talaromyces atroroseus]OKL60370.1 hypothetical protein UA08_04151 [Talaromyces atroroseus]